MRFDLSDEEWSALEPLLPAAKHGPARVDDRRVLNGICLTVTGRARRCIIGITVGPSGGFGKGYSMPWRKSATTR